MPFGWVAHEGGHFETVKIEQAITTAAISAAVDVYVNIAEVRLAAHRRDVKARPRAC
jgi:hypothetical protein